MRHTRYLLLALGLWALSTADSPADPQETPKKLPPILQASPEEFIKRFDKNKDGSLQKDELPPRLAELFDRADANGDGKLDKEEVTRMLEVLRQRLGADGKGKGKGKNKQKGDAKGPLEDRVNLLLERMDTNKDGKISRDEAKGPLAKGFDRLDTNGDGYLDRAELRRAAEKLGQLKGLAKNKAGKAERPTPRTGPDFDSLDKNADGRLTRDELQSTPLADRFDEIDANKDGKIDKKEFEAFLKKQDEKKDK